MLLFYALLYDRIIHGCLGMIKNKLGVRNYEHLAQVEKEIVSTKIKLLDDRITFNIDELNLEFLVRIHKFLFGDIYDEEYTTTRQVTNKELKDLNNIFTQLMKLGIVGENIDLQLLESLFVKLWYYQLFYDGNTRTLLAFLKIYIEYYQLPVEYKTDLEINSDPKIFKLKRRQQKRVDSI